MKNKKHWFTNGSIDKMCYECPEGFWPGRTVSDSWRKNQSKASSKCRWYNNGIEETFTQNCPDGYMPGRLEFPESFHNNQSKAQKDRWENMSDGEYTEACRARSIGIKNMSKDKKDERSKKLSIKKKLWWENATTEQLIQMRERLETTLTSNGIQQWHSFEEDDLYNFLCKIYDDVKRQYRNDLRYPFFCDFYIPSEDLFIEYNGFWTHGSHPFDKNNPEDISILNDWKSKQKLVLNKDNELVENLYYNAEKCWTINDPLKIKYAITNKLNYILIYPNDKKYIWEKGRLINNGKNC